MMAARSRQLRSSGIGVCWISSWSTIQIGWYPEFFGAMAGTCAAVVLKSTLGQHLIGSFIGGTMEKFTVADVAKGVLK